MCDVLLPYVFPLPAFWCQGDLIQPQPRPVYVHVCGAALSCVCPCPTFSDVLAHSFSWHDDDFDPKPETQNQLFALSC